MLNEKVAMITDIIYKNPNDIEVKWNIKTLSFLQLYCYNIDTLFDHGITSFSLLICGR